jgi:phage/plasmid-associated DNA primase
VREATAGYFRDEDTFGQFFESECVFGADAKVTRKEIRDRYVAWCQEADERPVSPKGFAAALRDKGASEHTVRIDVGPRRGWLGVRLVVDAEREARSHVATSSHRVPVGSYIDAPRASNRELVPTGDYAATGSQEDFAEYLERQAIEGTE